MLDEYSWIGRCYIRMETSFQQEHGVVCAREDSLISGKLTTEPDAEHIEPRIGVDLLGVGFIFNLHFLFEFVVGIDRYIVIYKREESTQPHQKKKKILEVNVQNYSQNCTPHHDINKPHLKTIHNIDTIHKMTNLSIYYRCWWDCLFMFLFFVFFTVRFILYKARVPIDLECYRVSVRVYAYT